MKTSHILTTLAVVATLAIVNVAAAAQQGERAQGEGSFRHQAREEVQKALQKGDYNAWKEAMTPKICQHVNEDNFNMFADMHEAIKNGDKEKAEELRTQLGLPERPERPMLGEKGMGKGKSMRYNSQITK